MRLHKERPALFGALQLNEMVLVVTTTQPPQSHLDALRAPLQRSNGLVNCVRLNERILFFSPEFFMKNPTHTWWSLPVLHS